HSARFVVGGRRMRRPIARRSNHKGLLLTERPTESRIPLWPGVGPVVGKRTHAWASVQERTQRSRLLCVRRDSSLSGRLARLSATGELMPDAKAVTLKHTAAVNAHVYVTAGDTLKSEHLFFDQLDFLGQFGLLPG